MSVLALWHGFQLNASARLVEHDLRSRRAVHFRSQLKDCQRLFKAFRPHGIDKPEAVMNAIGRFRMRLVALLTYVH
jgi:hypothetical protein